MNKVLTEAELWDIDSKSENQMRRNLHLDKQDGIIQTFSMHIKCSKKCLKQMSDQIEEWMNKNDHETYLILSLKTTDGEYKEIYFDKYIVNFQWCRNNIEQWMFVKCRNEGYPKIHTKHIQNIQLPGDCYKYDLENNPIYPKVFNLLSHEEHFRNHSSILKPSITKEEVDKIIEERYKIKDNNE